VIPAQQCRSLRHPGTTVRLCHTVCQPSDFLCLACAQLHVRVWFAICAEYEPTALMRSDGDLDVWTCSGAVPPNNFDAIVHTRLPVSSGGVVPRHQRPVPALVPTHNASHIDGWGVCAPSVLGVPASAELRMYYECASFLTDRPTGAVFTGFCQVCLARSVFGGQEWEKWGGDRRGWVAATEPAEPVATAPQHQLISTLNLTVLV
jgi:hypothetical protein